MEMQVPEEILGKLMSLRVLSEEVLELVRGKIGEEGDVELVM